MNNKVSVTEVKDIMYCALKGAVTRKQIDVLYDVLKDYLIKAIYEGRAVPTVFGYVKPVVFKERPNNLKRGNVPDTIPAHVQLKLSTSKDLRRALYSIPVVDGQAQFTE